MEVQVSVQDMPEPLSDNKTAIKAAASPPPSPTWSHWLRQHWLFGCLAVLACVGVGLGVGLGLGLGRRSTSSRSGATIGVARVYYIAADPVNWDYAKGGRNQCADRFAPPDLNLEPGVPTMDGPAVGGIFRKAQYREYTDGSFTVLKERSSQQAYLGLLGPVMVAEAGDTIEVHLRNNLAFPVNMEPSGAANWATPTGLTPALAPGRTTVLYWQVPLDAAPLSFNTTTAAAAGLQASRLYLYRSSVDYQAHDNLGLVGPLIVTAKGAARPDGRAADVDQDVVVLFQAINEQASPMVWPNAKDPLLATASFKKMTVNGFTWCTQPPISLVQGQRVRWHLASVGTEDSLHSFHWHGNTLQYQGHNVDNWDLMGSGTASLDMQPDEPGSWLLHCHVNFHLNNGMAVTYNVLPSSPPLPPPVMTGVTRTYYIAAEEVTWDYAPSGGQMCSGEVEPFDEGAAVFLGPPEGIRIGSNYTKAQFFEYTDANFSTRVERRPEEAYLGLVGPLLRATVGDTIVVMFLNRIRYYASLHPHGVRYNKRNEGSPYNDGQGDTKQDDYVVPRGGNYTYTWLVTERAGPGPADPSSKLWMYHSHVHEASDTYSGMFGGILITRRGAAQTAAAGGNTSVLPLTKPTDVDQEVVLFFSVINEAGSLYTFDNVRQYLDQSLWTTSELYDTLLKNASFEESSLKHAVNGFMFCNMPRISFVAGSRVRLHIMVLGSVEDMHTPSIGGGTFLSLGERGASVATIAGSMMSQDVMFTQPGNFSVQCRVLDHVMAGMQALYTVLPAPSGQLAVAGAASVQRVYYIAAEQVSWNFAPQGYVQCTSTDQLGSALTYITKTFQSIGSTRLKAQYRRYTDASFSQLSPQPSSHGLPGPLVAAEVGDIITVVLLNRLPFNVTFTPDGGLVTLGDTVHGAVVEPGQNLTYSWVVPQQAGPSKEDLPSVAYTYSSTLSPSHEVAGLVGLMLITPKGGLRPDGVTPTDVDQLIPLMFQVYDETLSPLHEANLEAAGLTGPDAELLAESPAFLASQMMHSINGYIFCNLPPPSVVAGSRVRFLLAAFGSEEGMHSPRFPGQLLTTATGPVQASALMPALTRVVDMTPVSPGTWTIMCDIHDHTEAGMIAQLVVKPAGSGTSPSLAGRRALA
ncbi:ferroxidase-like protein [Haematococcus lacustris]